MAFRAWSLETEEPAYPRTHEATETFVYQAPWKINTLEKIRALEMRETAVREAIFDYHVSCLTATVHMWRRVYRVGPPQCDPVHCRLCAVWFRQNVNSYDSDEC